MRMSPIQRVNKPENDDPSIPDEIKFELRLRE
jgi:hypothetical protein